MIDTILKLIGVRSERPPRHVETFNRAMARLDSSLEPAKDPFGEMLESMAKDAKRSNKTSKRRAS